MIELISENALTALKDIGLTDYESRAYSYLLKMGVTTASQISENTNIPYSKIYEVLNSLEKKGWIETRSGRPKRYYPKSPVEALEAHRLRLEDTMMTWRKMVLDELQPLYEKREIREKTDIWILRGEFDAIAKLKDVVENAKDELMVAIPTLTKNLVDAVLPMFRTLVDPNVKLFIMVSRDQKLSSEELLGINEVKVRDEMFGGGIIADSREVLLILGENKPSLIIWSDHLGLVKFAKDYFQHLWNTAERI